MNRIHRARSLPLCFALVIPLLALPAMAALGGDAASVQQDASQFKSALRSTQKQSYAVHEMRAESGTTVREFVSPSGKVFGVAWQGPSVPDMRQVLGAYYQRFSSAVDPKRRPRGPMVINESGFVFQSGGHMAAFTGKAYIPEMLPEGVHADAIQ
jgi:Protein of unknown function (DUF2844)